MSDQNTPLLSNILAFLQAEIGANLTTDQVSKLKDMLSVPMADPIPQMKHKYFQGWANKETVNFTADGSVIIGFPSEGNTVDALHGPNQLVVFAVPNWMAFPAGRACEKYLQSLENLTDKAND